MNERYFEKDDDSRRAASAYGERGRFATVFGRGDRNAPDEGVRRSDPARANDSLYAPEMRQPASGAGGTVIYSPTTYEDVKLLIDHLKMNEQVIVDFSDVNQTSVYRILDFMSGAIYALGGSIKQITKNIFLFAPRGVTITVPPQLGRR